MLNLHNLTTQLVAQDLFPGVTVRQMTVTFVFYIPGIRELFLSSGERSIAVRRDSSHTHLGFIDASRPSAEHALRTGQSLVVSTGGGACVHP